MGVWWGYYVGGKMGREGRIGKIGKIKKIGKKSVVGGLYPLRMVGWRAGGLYPLRMVGAS